MGWGVVQRRTEGCDMWPGLTAIQMFPGAQRLYGGRVSWLLAGEPYGRS